MNTHPQTPEGALINASPTVVTIWSDIGCPWATLALHLLREAAVTAGVELEIDHRAFPLELFNRRPTPKLILDSEIAVIGSWRPELGWGPWQRPDSEYAGSTLPAMEAVQAAKTPRVGGLVASDRLDEALRNAFYAESRCISIIPEIIEIARACPDVDDGALTEELELGRHRKAVFDQWRAAAAGVVRGSPHLFSTHGHDLHNPGVRYSWSKEPGSGFPVIESIDTSWATQLVNSMRTHL